MFAVFKLAGKNSVENDELTISNIKLMRVLLNDFKIL